MVIKTGRFGKFLACSNYPDCKNTKKMLVNGEGKLEVAQEEVSSEVCEKCGAPMVVKAGRFGKFLACSNYPKCRNTKKIGPAGGEKAEPAKATQTGENCEKCGSPLVFRKGRFGPFIACSDYPRCRFTKKVSARPGGEDGKPPGAENLGSQGTTVQKEEPEPKKFRKKKES